MFEGELLVIEEEALEAFVLGNNKPGICECCEIEVTHIFATPSLTKYIDPTANEPHNLCYQCAVEHLHIMEDQWTEYYMGLF